MYDLVSSKNIACIYFFLYIVQAGIVAVGDDGLGLCLESVQIVYDLAAEEVGSVFEGRFVDDDFCTLGLDSLHHTLNGALAEVVAVGFHGETVDTDDWDC